MGTVQPYRIAILFRLAPVCLLLVAGCTILNPFSTEYRIKTYLVKYPNRPEEIRQGVEDGKLVKGMTREETRLAWGRPNDTRVTSDDDGRRETWHYWDVLKVDGNDMSSRLHDVKMPIGNIVFTNSAIGPVIAEWTIYSEKAEKREAAEARAREAAARRQAEKRRPPPEPVFQTTAADVSQWPALMITGIIAGGGGRIALINGQSLKTGETIDGVTVLGIRAKGVYFQRGKEIIFLKTNQSIFDLNKGSKTGR